MSRATMKYFSNPGRFGAGRLFAAALCAALVPSLAFAQNPEKRYDPPSQFDLSSGPTAVLQGNDFQCGLRNVGETCVDIFNSPTGGGGFWPTGSPNQYMFNSGLQVVGMIPEDAGFAWAGDTVGAFFMDASGRYQHGTPVTEIYNSLEQEDRENWPGTDPETGERTEPNFVGYSASDFPDQSAYVSDEELFNEVLIGRRAASQQDSWVLYWDGDPNAGGGRDHPMGILVEQRTLAWNYPSGNENVIYFIFRFTNVTNNPTFQRISEAQYFGGDPDALPDEGWTFDSVYVAYDSDPDVTGDFSSNYATAVLPFDVGLAYSGTFFAPEFEYSPRYFFPPFFENAPGLLGVKYLKSPIDPATGEEVGLTSFSLHTNGGRFPDPSSVEQGWRYISLNVDPSEGDPDCSFPLNEIKERRSCFLAQNQADVRFFVGSGPFSLEPGQSETVATAMYAAATVATSEIEASEGADNKPGEPSLAPGCHGNPIRPIETAAGYVAPLECPPEGEPIDQFDVEVVPLSLLGRALIAQSIFDNDFLLGFAPETPDFFLVPGDGKVSVIWEESRTEEEGDPFFAAAGDPENPLFDPNYREFDVEGYRIYKGTTPANMELLAQFDKEGSTFTDFSCVTDPTFVTGDVCEEERTVSLDEPFVQYPTGGIVELANGDLIVLEADTALADDIAGGDAEQLSGTGIPFTYVDNNVQNGFQYFYQVTAFDVNSLVSGPSSLESSSAAESVVPRASAPNLQLAEFSTELRGASGMALNPNAPVPSIDEESGTFSGPMPPTDRLEATFQPLVPQLLPAFNLTATIDSIIPGPVGCPDVAGGFLGSSCWQLYMTFNRDGETTQVVRSGWTPMWAGVFGDPSDERENIVLGQASVAADEASASRFDIPSGFVDFNATVLGSFFQSITFSASEGQAVRRGLTSTASGSRWFDGEEESVTDPTVFTRVGHLEAVDTVWKPVHHTHDPNPIYGDGGGTYPASSAMQCVSYGLGYLSRAADVRVTWQGGTFGEVRDVSHDVDVPFKPTVQTSYGFLNEDANGNGVLDWDDFFYVENISPIISSVGTYCNHDGSGTATLDDTPELMPTSTQGFSPGDVEQTGTGFGLWINGERYIFETEQLPADGTVWTLRTYSGTIDADEGETANPSNYEFEGLPRPPLVPGLTLSFTSEAPTELVGEADLTRVHTVPDPYYAVGPYDLSPVAKELQFVNLPVEATIRIYSVSGILVDVVQHEDPSAGGRATWDLRNRSGQNVASGVYFFHVSTPDGDSHTGKFTVINSAYGQ